ncbi:DNA-directed RNA polymerase I and III 14 KDA polypeptide [Ascosphaera apis ARSEF 7405]|uniref:DNA-directed RNA polymerases I and III subunit RPAC2 n=1 Tax=Ascosphaera apis ARSEF 7405 TaxID=392613 RepID=A0A166N815_9EURO|nr:DNA-directed RNA polymerase I and III 14 KDA polypeptide [Ascosphaera apis ARSEF 7405]
MSGVVDETMTDVAAATAAVPEIFEEEDSRPIAADRITILPGATETAASFQFEGEDHTLGNSLRYVIMKNPDVEFCGYTIPHPSETKMNLRIQTYDSTNVFEALQKGLDDLMDLCDAVTEKFTIARDEFNAQKTQ